MSPPPTAPTEEQRATGNRAIRLGQDPVRIIRFVARGIAVSGAFFAVLALVVAPARNALPPAIGGCCAGAAAGWWALGGILLALSGLLAAEHLGMVSSQPMPADTMSYTRWLSLAAAAGLLFYGVLIYDRIRSTAVRELSAANADLTEAMERIEALQGLVPICMHCKSVRLQPEGDEWERVEDYIKRYGDVRFSHGICASCANKFYPDLAD